MRPRQGLKALAVDALKVAEDEIMAFGDIEPRNIYGEDGKAIALDECGYAPYALAVEDVPGHWMKSWPRFIKTHIDHWHTHEKAAALRRKGHRLHPGPV